MYSIKKVNNSKFDYGTWGVAEISKVVNDHDVIGKEEPASIQRLSN